MSKMRVITIANRKGGSGKSTCISNFIVEAASRGIKTAVIDMDPQKTLTNWWNRRADALECVDMISPPPAQKLQYGLQTLEKAGYECCFIDTPGYEDQNAIFSIKSADVLVVPLRPMGVDLAAGSRTIAFAQKEQKKIVFVLSQVLPKTNFKDLFPIASALSKWGTVAPAVIYSDNDYGVALETGRSIFDFDKNKGAQIGLIYEFIMSTFNVEDYHE